MHRSVGRVHWMQALFVLAAFAGRPDFTRADETAPKKAEPAATAKAAASPVGESKTQTPAPAWENSLRRAVPLAIQQSKPILVNFGAPWCGWCKELEKEFAKPEMKTELGRWVLVYLDVEKSPAEAARLAVGPTPALRLLASDGRVVDSHDGFAPADELVSWLKDKFAEAKSAPINDLLDDAEPEGAALVRLVRELGQRNPVMREAALGRLAPIPHSAAPFVVVALADARLQTRLSAAELLREWNAPLVGEIDPWRPETMPKEAVEQLKEWAAKIGEAAPDPPKELTVEQKKDAEAEIERLLRAEDSAVEAIRERMARLGPGLLPTVYDRLRRVESDSDRQRLTALRYRLTASPSLALRWRGGIDRLAALDVETRYRAADELVKQARAKDENLLLELFSDADPLVRETALRGLYELNGQSAAGALARLLDDPDPNVRAAVLKLFAEHPPANAAEKLGEYIAKEKDPDLVVHAVRVLREMPQSAAPTLLKLIKHESWRVRAEVAEALAKSVSSRYGFSNNNEQTADIYVGILDMVDDVDGFVVGKAISALEHAELPLAVPKLIKSAEAHPELAGAVVELLANNASMRDKAIPHLREFSKSQNAEVRKAAVTGLCTAQGEGHEDAVRAALEDPSSSVRRAAVRGMLGIVNGKRPSQQAGAFAIAQTAGTSGSIVETIGNVVRVFTGKAPGNAMPVAITRVETFVPVPGAGADKPGPAPVPVPAPPVATKPEASPSEPKTAAAESKPAAAAPEPGETEVDAWLTAFQIKGKGRPAWMVEQQPKLERMLEAPDAEERIDAAVLLIALGLGAKAKPALLEVVANDASLAGKAGAALGWLPWNGRIELFEQLLATKPKADVVAGIAQEMVEVYDRRAIAAVWPLMSDPVPGAAVAKGIHWYLGYHYQGSGNEAKTEGARKRMAADLVPRVKAGSEWQRFLALALLVSASPDDAAAAAQEILDDLKAPPSLRRDALQVLLLIKTGAERTAIALAAFEKPETEFWEIALVALAEGAGSLQTFRESFHLYYASEMFFDVRAEGHELRKPPKGVEPRHLEKIRAQGSPAAAALANFYLVLLDQPNALEPLIAYWRKQPRTDSKTQGYVVEAIGYAGDDAHVPILEEIYDRFEPDDSGVKDFYWKIRGMEGPRARALRKKIRDEAGPEILR